MAERSHLAYSCTHTQSELVCMAVVQAELAAKELESLSSMRRNRDGSNFVVEAYRRDLELD